jgi:hypothetical protein
MPDEEWSAKLVRWFKFFVRATWNELRGRPDALVTTEVDSANSDQHGARETTPVIASPAPTKVEIPHREGFWTRSGGAIAVALVAAAATIAAAIIAKS